MMIDMPAGTHRVRRGDVRPPAEYDLWVDGERAGWAERLVHGQWRFYYSADGDWAKFGRPGAFAQGTQWLADLHRSAQARNTQVTATAAADVHVITEPFELSPLVADPFSTFRDDPFADPLS